MAPNYMLSRARMQRGWSQSAMAKKLKTSSKNVSCWESGETFPSSHFRKRLCQLFELDAEALGLVPALALADNYGTGNHAVVEKSLYAVAPSQFSNANAQELVGRDQLLQDLLQQILPGSILTLAGLPGVGKTALLQKLTRHPQIQERFPDGVIWVELGPTPDIPRCISCIAHLLGLSSFVQQQEPSEGGRLHLLVHLLRETIGTRRFLIVFDDVWAAEGVLPFLVRSPSVAYVLSTRLPKIANDLEGRAPTVVPPLSFQASHRLLTMLIPRMETLNETRLRQVIAHTGGVPLAIMLIGKYLASQCYEGVFPEEERVFNFLNNRARRLYLSMPLPPVIGAHGQSRENLCSLNAALALSDGYLPPIAQTALRALSVLPKAPDAFSREAALAVGAISTEVLDMLVDAGLLEPTENRRYRMHQIVGDYASHHLAEKTPQLRLVKYMEKICVDRVANMAVLDREYSTLLAALDCAEALQMYQELVQGVLALEPHMNMHGFFTLANQYLCKALDAANASQDLFIARKNQLHAPTLDMSGLDEISSVASQSFWKAIQYY